MYASHSHHSILDERRGENGNLLLPEEEGKGNSGWLGVIRPQLFKKASFYTKRNICAKNCLLYGKSLYLTEK